MPQKRDAFGPVRPWVAPALGVGLVVAGIAMVAGMASLYAPIVGVAVAGVILLFGYWRVSRSSRPDPT
ncbi:MAG TPA: hypothetical protein VFG00_04295, partial [Acidothermaceae bacterium]|nr:hypothetical protein [Acidothermaceae bacterium]